MTAADDAIDAILAGARPSDLETNVLEFKEEPPNAKEALEILADAVVCLANSEGGTIIFGIADKESGANAIKGVRRLDARQIVTGIFERTRPPMSVHVTPRSVDGHQLFSLAVPAGATIYANAKGTATRRANDQCRPFPPEEQRQVLASRGIYDWSAEPSGCSAVDETEMVRVRRLLRNAGREDLAGQEDRRLLADLRLATSSGELTNAGLLLVGREDDIRRIVPSYGYSYQYRPSRGSEATGRLRGQRPILAGIESVIDAVGSRVQIAPLNVSGGVQVAREDYPSDAIRELVVNAFIHRDYGVAGAVDVEHTPEVLRITSPGGLVFGVTPQNILSHPSTPRNRLLLETITALQFAERTGQGVDRSYRSMLRSGKKPPSFIDTGSRVDVLIEGGSGDGAFTRYVRVQLDEALAGDIDILLTLDMLRTSRRVDAHAVAMACQTIVEDGQRVLARMSEAGLVHPTRRTAAKEFPNYELSPEALAGLGLAITYHRRRADGADEKVTEHIREYGYVTNQTVRRLFDLEMAAARDMLRDLVNRGLIVKSAGAARGPSVRYERGPNFPAAR